MFCRRGSFAVEDVTAFLVILVLLGFAIVRIFELVEKAKGIPISGLRLMSSRLGFFPPWSLAQVLSHVLSSTRRVWHFESYSAFVRSSMVVKHAESDEEDFVKR